MRRFIVVVIVFAVLLPIVMVVLDGASQRIHADDKVAAKKIAKEKTTFDFSSDIRPILSETCFQCHGPDKESREADLRLDTKAGAFANLDGHKAIVPGHPEKSELYLRLTTQDKDEQMPPADFKKRVTPQQIEKLRLWILSGAKWEEHWAFTPPVKAPLPQVKKTKWVHNPIDNFVLKRLEQEHLSPSKEADKITLLRRLSLDLIGLPPTPKEVERFLKDKKLGAYERQVERLLASPHYGERWGRVWLDAARYADSNGFEKDAQRTVWAYRDWVINSVNNDQPYNQFIIEQIAGDLLPNATQNQRVATGFLRNTMVNEEGGVDPEEFRMLAIIDRMDAVGKSVLGLTVQCAQCHSHKYDPLTQEEYYKMFAYLNDSSEGSIPVYSREEQLQRAGLFAGIKKIEDQLKQQSPHWKTEMKKWEASVKNDQPQWKVLPVKSNTLAQRHYYLKDGSLLAQGYAPSRYDHKYSWTLKAPLKAGSFQVEMLTDDNLPAQGPGRGINGLYALSEFSVEVIEPQNPKSKTKPKKRKLKFIRATSDANGKRTQLPLFYQGKLGNRGFLGPAEYAIDGKNETAWGNVFAGAGRRNRASKIVFQLKNPEEFVKGTKLTIVLTQKHGGWNSNEPVNLNLGRFRLSTTEDSHMIADPLPKKVRKLLSVPYNRRTARDINTIFSYWRTTVPSWKSANARIEKFWKMHPEGTTQLVYAKQSHPRKTYFLKRGDWLKHGDEVQPGVPIFLNPLPSRRSNSTGSRLTFARWLVDRDSPTAARTFVNRTWQALFGTGFCSTSDDLGSQGEPPSHPQLLDWLSVNFMEQDWSRKKLHRLIVTSATYRQSSRVTPSLLKKDPYNRLFARGARFRVDAEIVRDIALASSGLLNNTIGGPSVYPEAPRFLFLPPASYGNKEWTTERGKNRYRRSIYTFQYRSVPYPALQTFDKPNGDISCVRRARSNTPLQALTVLNEPIFMECAEALARKIIRRKLKNDEQKIAYAFKHVLSRPPSKKEAATLLQFLTRQKKRFAKREADPSKILTSVDTNLQLFNITNLPNFKPSPATVASLTLLCRVILNLDETITRE
ncbi:hypothetical protein MNBD_PLANCTO02-3192 [hydrothermal vent metagenome]|uniref:Cytochrome c domain-containing protein n=1 Tax=hydrothermal vent metagenome TaxID=652676 RepID=A0A3B1D4U3_9ZZZZ